MGLSNDIDARSSTPEADETLPLYEDHVPTELQPPEPKATPDEVRDFLVAVMQRRGLGIDHARRLAGKWTLGTGRELRSYPVGQLQGAKGPTEVTQSDLTLTPLLFSENSLTNGNRWPCSAMSGVPKMGK